MLLGCALPLAFRDSLWCCPGEIGDGGAAALEGEAPEGAIEPQDDGDNDVEG